MLLLNIILAATAFPPKHNKQNHINLILEDRVAQWDKERGGGEEKIELGVKF